LARAKVSSDRVSGRQLSDEVIDRFLRRHISPAAVLLQVSDDLG
jgi:hypothetical protein